MGGFPHIFKNVLSLVPPIVKSLMGEVCLVFKHFAINTVFGHLVVKGFTGNL